MCYLLFFLQLTNLVLFNLIIFHKPADERFQEERNTAYISKWLRKSIRQYHSFDMSLERLKSFFIDAKVIFLCSEFTFQFLTSTISCLDH